MAGEGKELPAKAYLRPGLRGAVLLLLLTNVCWAVTSGSHYAELKNMNSSARGIQFK
jgi:hypothetical protein